MEMPSWHLINHPAGMHDNQICSTMLYFTMIVKTTLDSSKCRSVKTDVTNPEEKSQELHLQFFQGISIETDCSFSYIETECLSTGMYRYIPLSYIDTDCSFKIIVF